MSNSFPIGLIFFLLYYFLKDQNNTPDTTRRLIEDPFKDELLRKKVVYISNDRILQEPLFFHYYNILVLQEAPEVNGETIEIAASIGYSLLNDIEYKDCFSIKSKDIKAAKYFMIDRWNYLSHLN